MSTVTGDSSAKPEKHRDPPKILFRTAVCVLILAAGFLFMKKISSVKKAPHKRAYQEKAVEVEVKEAVPEDVKARLEGYGVAESLKEVRISSEVSGKIAETHARFRPGRIIGKGETLFRIDPADYRADVVKARADLQQKEAEIARIEKEKAGDKQRIETVRRTAELARAEYIRTKTLFEENRVGNRSGVDQAEQAYNSAKDQADQLEKVLDLYPSRLGAARAQAEAARAGLARAEKNLERCTVSAPFTCRIKNTAMEAGEYVSSGQEVLTVADDSVLEITVSLDSREAARWLKFEKREQPETGMWFPKPRGVPCRVMWTEAEDAVRTGVLHQVKKLNRESRTLSLVVRVAGMGDKMDETGGIGLAAGMFCRVVIPGRTLENLYRVPRWAVTTDDTIYTAENGRLKTVHVTREYAQGEDVFVSGNIREGDTLITTRLVDPLENTRLKIVNRNGAE